jgi:hypothetical protein
MEVNPGAVLFLTFVHLSGVLFCIGVACAVGLVTVAVAPR